MTNSALVLAGNVEKLTKTRPAEMGSLDQIHSRIGLRVHLDTPTAADCRAIAVTFNVEGLDAYQELEAFGSRSNLRELVRLLVEAQEITEASGIRLPHIRAVAQALYGNRDALANPRPIN